MIALPPAQVLLLSGDPARHRSSLSHLRAHGLRVRAARDQHHALRLLDPAPALVLVDVSCPEMLGPKVIERLNRIRGACLVLAVHDGHLHANLGEMAQLAVDGFCRVGDYTPLARAALAQDTRARQWAH